MQSCWDFSHGDVGSNCSKARQNFFFFKGSERVTSNACVFQKSSPTLSEGKLWWEIKKKKKTLHCLHRTALRGSAHSLAPGEEKNVQNAAPSLRLHTQPLGWACSEKQFFKLQALSSKTIPLKRRHTSCPTSLLSEIGAASTVPATSPLLLFHQPSRTPALQRH